jgi:outer membrane lipoprotein-sorting protein
MKRITLILAFAMVASLTSAAQDKSKTEAPKTEAPKTDAKPVALPNAEEILEKYVKALGGKEAIEKLTSRSAKGTFEIEAMNLTGDIETHHKAPNKFANLFTIPGVGGGGQVFDGTKGWDSNPMTGLRELSGEELAVLKREADFYQPLNFKKHFPKLEVKGKETVGSSETYVVVASPAEGGPEKLYFDTATGLLVRQDAERETAQGKMATEEYFEDYKDVGGVKIPHLLKIVSPMFGLKLKLTEVKTNVEIDEAKFNKPSN